MIILEGVSKFFDVNMLDGSFFGPNYLNKEKILPDYFISHSQNISQIHYPSRKASKISLQEVKFQHKIWILTYGTFQR